jgi:hypothetical protein
MNSGALTQHRESKTQITECECADDCWLYYIHLPAMVKAFYFQTEIQPVKIMLWNNT